MMSSARILAQRYLEGDLNDLELQAFLEDVENDPRIAEVLEQEAQLDLAILDDAYSNEPPAHIRDAVLSSIITTSNRETRVLLVPMARQLLVGLIFLVASVVRIEVPETLRSDTTVWDKSGTSQQRVSSDMSCVVVSPSDVELSMTNQSIEQPTPRLESDVVPVHRAHALNSYGVHVRQEFSSPKETVVTDRPVMQMAAAPGAVSGLISGAGASFRYQLGSVDDVRLFVESGFLSAARQTSLFINGISQVSREQAHLPFAVVGVEGTLAYVSMLDRDIRGSIALGMAATGPLAIADVSTALVQIGPTTIDAGLRFFGAIDLRNQSNTMFQTQPFLRVTMGL
jgi:hypothetical protein